MLDFSVTFVITIVNIALLFLVLRAVLFKRVTKFMEDRARRIQDSIEQSEKDKSQAKALLAQSEARLKTAETEAEAILREARESARIEGERIVAESRAAAESALAGARKQLETEREAAAAAFRKEAAALIAGAAGRLLGREMRNEDNLRYASLLLDALPLDETASGGAGGN